MGKVIMFASNKGGNGKSTCAHCVAGVMAYMKKKVLVVDTDMQANISKYLGASEQAPSLFDVLNADVESIDAAIQELNGIDLIRGSETLSRCDKEFTEVDDLYILNDLLESLKENYDFILIDSPPAKSYIVTSSIIAADYVIIPTECDDGNVDGVASIINDVDKLTTGKRKYSNAKVMGIIVNKYENTTLHKFTKEDRLPLLVQDREYPVFIASARKNIAVSECKNFKQTLQQYNKNCSSGRDFYHITEMIIERCANE